MVNAADLKSAAAKAACGFEPRPRHRDSPLRHQVVMYAHGWLPAVVVMQ